MKGTYKTKEGSKVEVLDFDEANKIAMIKVDDVQNKWVDENEYKHWELLESLSTQEIVEVVEEAEEIPEEKEVKPKRTYKKKTK